ncbi:hypothetical protein D3C71_2082270 [compost metagenome]
MNIHGTALQLTNLVHAADMIKMRMRQQNRNDIHVGNLFDQRLGIHTGIDNNALICLWIRQ